MKISIGSDHAGFEYKVRLINFLKSEGYEVIDFGTDSNESVDYPDFIKPAAISVTQKTSDLGIVLGGSGNGEAIAANKVKGIRCAVCWSTDSAKLAMEHNDANMISIGQRMVSIELAMQIVSAWLNAEFKGGRHTNRIQKIEKEY